MFLFLKSAFLLKDYKKLESNSLSWYLSWKKESFQNHICLLSFLHFFRIEMIYRKLVPLAPHCCFLWRNACCCEEKEKEKPKIGGESITLGYKKD